MPYAIRKVREEIVTEEMIAEARGRWQGVESCLSAGICVRNRSNYAWRGICREKYNHLIDKRERQQRELADGTLVLETEATDD